MCTHVCDALALSPAVPVQETWGEAIRRKAEAGLLDQICILLIKRLML